ncbi:diaminopimelate decarboxylase [Nitrosophilus alvini]|uniref:diaminopimelate decarboxylase n=1 Tax=Nitrosophilus alvini TaxID=2714855 RepID=UPI001F291C6D|nr:diaminopimelate decarboxylase [Nitrosophilus alvini]
MIDYKYLAQKYDTPLYLYDFEKIENSFLSLKNAFKGRKSLIAYAVKANSNLSVLKHLASLGTGADCVSIGEVKRALLAGIPSYKIVFSGVGKRDEEIEEALKLDILYINLESEAELQRVEDIAAQLGKKARVSIRVNPNIDPKTHPYISTGLHENKFGVEIDTAKKMYLAAKKSNFLDPVGIHFHIGSQLTELEPIKEASAIVADLVRSLHKIDIEIKFFDIGGGLGIKYDNEETIKPYDYAQAILATLKGLDLTIVCEPGRYIVGDAGYFLTKVLYEKKSGDKRFIIVDGGMNDLLRPSLYNAYHKVEVIGKTGDETPADVVGPVCESGDFFAKNRPLPSTSPGDIIVVYSAGAYGFVMSSNYNTRPRPAEVALFKGSDRLIRKRETFEDIIKNEIELMDE